MSARLAPRSNHAHPPSLAIALRAHPAPLAARVICSGALPIWWSFYFSGREMWAAFWLYIYTLPVSMLMNIWLMPGEFPFFTGDYFLAHSLYFGCAVLLLTALLWLILQLWVGFLRRCPARAEPQ
ncbi:hypothetical protein HZU75_08450 [Chitinibacter fontanus]|uniref:Uncharacterized protein n=1 Tax=Chitinibacter fontanus TaxID=1737446 RepID=A0A7D5V9E1_9NEIS|nr:hypothetical protein [Chitinibacter fontanus]QLI81557.1 hypothetical protein HZU75_08450 [Chitinibacter fontanus]